MDKATPRSHHQDLQQPSTPVVPEEEGWQEFGYYVESEKAERHEPERQTPSHSIQPLWVRVGWQRQSPGSIELRLDPH